MTSSLQNSRLTHAINASNLAKGRMKVSSLSFGSKTKSQAVREIQSLLFKMTGHRCSVDSSQRQKWYVSPMVPRAPGISSGERII